MFQSVVAINPVHVRVIGSSEIVAQHLQSVGVTFDILVKSQNIKASSVLLVGKEGNGCVLRSVIRNGQT